MNNQEILRRLQALAEPEYAQFSAALLPGSRPLLGVRLPALRAMAKELARTPEAALAALTDATFEEQMLRGLVTAYAKGGAGERQARLEALLPHIENWSVCDSTAMTCKFMAAQPEFWLPWLQALARSDREFTARFGLVCLLDHFTATPQGRRAVLQSCGQAACGAPYVRLAVAWAVSVVVVKEPPLGLEFLRQGGLDEATRNKAIQKSCESRRVTPALRDELRALRRSPAHNSPRGKDKKVEFSMMQEEKSKTT